MAMCLAWSTYQYLSASSLTESPGNYEGLEGGQGNGDVYVIKVLQKLHSATIRAKEGKIGGHGRKAFEPRGRCLSRQP
jgi:hypothetical protein